MHDMDRFWSKIKRRKDATGTRSFALWILAVLAAAGTVGGSAMAAPVASLETMVEPLGRVTACTCDTGNGLTGIGYSAGTDVTAYTYNKLGLLTEARNERGEVVSYKYNLEGKPIEITYPNHESVTRAYDSYGRLKEITDWNSRTTKFSYNSDGNLTAIGFPSETANEDRYTYDGAEEMSGAKMLRGTEVLASLYYARDGDGQVKLATSQGLPGGEAVEYLYDGNDRLTKAGGTEYAYDSAGSPTRIGNDTYAYDSADELEAGAGVTYTYNEAGQRVEAAPVHGAATTYGYDKAGNLITVERPGRGHEPEIKDSYTYDGDGLRSSQTLGGRTSNLIWDTAEELPLLLSDGTNSYIYGPDGLPIEQISKAGRTLYFHHDQQGSTRLLTNAEGEVEASYTYSPYGKLITRTGTATTPLLYDGQYTNTDTGLVYLRARSYDPSTAQFLTIDPAIQVTGEPYGYTRDNPLNFVDPTGEQGGPDWWNPFSWTSNEWQVFGTEYRNGGARVVEGGLYIAAAGAVSANPATAAGGVAVGEIFVFGGAAAIAIGEIIRGASGP
jgi:RHS repeat-associated protein